MLCESQRISSTHPVHLPQGNITSNVAQKAPTVFSFVWWWLVNRWLFCCISHFWRFLHYQLCCGDNPQRPVLLLRLSLFFFFFSKYIYFCLRFLFHFYTYSTCQFVFEPLCGCVGVSYHVPEEKCLFSEELKCKFCISRRDEWSEGLFNKSSRNLYWNLQWVSKMFWCCCCLPGK